MQRETLDRPRLKPPEPHARETAQLPPLAEVAPPRHRVWPWIVLIAVLALGGGVFWIIHTRASDAAALAAKGKASHPTPVVTATARIGNMPIYLSGLGTVVPLNTVTVRTRVDGQIDKVAFTEGQTVHQGDLLFEIDPRPFQVQLDQAEGQLAKDQAALNNARLELERDKEAGDAIPKQQTDTQAALVLQSEGTVKIDQAAIESAKLNLTYSRITAPLSGRIGLKLVDQGNIVHAGDANGLAVITQLQPISVSFTLPQDDIPQLMHRMATPPPPTVDALNGDLSATLATGTVLAVDNQVDPTTGTIRVKAEFPNEDLDLFPNQFVNARLLVDTHRDVILIPVAAVQRGPDGTFVYVVKPDKTVTVRKITVGLIEGNRASIASGLEAGEMVVTDGVDKLLEGAAVIVHADATTRPAGGRKRIGQAHPASSQPATTQPMRANPTIAQPVMAQPATTHSALAQPAATAPALQPRTE